MTAKEGAGWLAQGTGPELTGHQGSGCLVEGWFQGSLDPAEKREKQAFSFPSEYGPSGSERLGCGRGQATFGFCC